MSQRKNVILLIGVVACLSCAESGSENGLLTGRDSEDLEKVVQAFEQTIKNLPAYSCDLKTSMHVQASGMDNRMVSDY